ncbi:MAG: AMP-dependent synthetase/ligase [Hyphomicrobiaceae bacterium]
MMASNQQTSFIDHGTARTIPGLFRERVARSPDAIAYREWSPAARQWQDYSWRDMARLVGRWQAGLSRTGLQKGDRVAIQLPNGTDWVAFDIAAMAAGLLTVPIYSHDGLTNVAHILANSGARLMVLNTFDQWAALAPLSSEFPTLEHVWVREAGTAGTSTASSSVTVGSLADALPSAAEPLLEPELSAEATATLIYTSGTTGPPKGVMLSHFAILWNCEAATKFIAPLPSDVFLSFLPLAHVFERTLGYYLPMMAGATVAYARAIETLREDLLTIRPTVLLAVPRIYERIEDGIRQEIGRSALKGALIRLTADIGWQRYEARRHRGPAPGLIRRLLWPLLDKFVARRLLGALGGSLRVAVSGGASLPPDTARFLVGLGLPLVEGYGLTEAAPVVTATRLGEIMPGSAGQPLHGLEIRLGDQDELQVRTPSVMKGYWKNETATAAAIDKDGWLRTGDVAEIRDGWLFIKGRLGERLALSTGEKVMASAIEAAIRRDPLFDQACVIGEGRPCLTAVISLNPALWQSAASELGVDVQAPNTASVAILDRINRSLGDLPRHEQVRAVHLVVEPWTIPQGLLTPTLKVKRKTVEEKYAAEIEGLYETLSKARKSVAAGGALVPQGSSEGAH